MQQKAQKYNKNKIALFCNFYNRKLSMGKREFVATQI